MLFKVKRDTKSRVFILVSTEQNVAEQVSKFRMWKDLCNANSNRMFNGYSYLIIYYTEKKGC